MLVPGLCSSRCVLHNAVFGALLSLRRTFLCGTKSLTGHLCSFSILLSMSSFSFQETCRAQTTLAGLVSTCLYFLALFICHSRFWAIYLTSTTSKDRSNVRRKNWTSPLSRLKRVAGALSLTESKAPLLQTGDTALELSGCLVTGFWNLSGFSMWPTLTVSNCMVSD